MVTKKVAVPLDTSNATTQSNPPYPTSPNGSSEVAATTLPKVYSPDLNTSPAFDLIDMNEARNRTRRDSDISSHGTWDTDFEEDKEEEAVEIPKPLRITPSKQNLVEQKDERDDIPAILKPGPPGGAVSMDQYAKQALANPWAEDTKLTPQGTGRSQTSNNPFLKPRYTGESDVISPASIPPAPPMPQHAVPAPPPVPQALPPPPLVPIELPTTSTPSQELSQLSLYTSTPTTSTFTQHAQAFQRKPVSPTQPLPVVVSPATSNPWQTSQSLAPQQKPTDDEAFYAPPPGPPPSNNMPSSLHTSPPARSNNLLAASQLQSRTNDDTTQKRNEHYQIKHINWQDKSTGTAIIRQTPILTQNVNGPCPLLALVNALVLTTPAHVNTALIETLRTREQVSLGLLLDAVFDELMSGRRGDTATALPDVSELYAFLLALHTGMNVNPRFVSASAGAGTFEQTREMRLYSTFNLPLIHGWTAAADTPAYTAFNRRAQSFEDAQNVQFAESELEDKLRAEGLTSEEQLILQDIQTIKHFLVTWPTQLTDHGLQAISTTLKPGQFAILFRNDHFSTIFKEPTHGALMTLVTDTGYSSHDEIVWESLVDVNGAASELFSGDFRTVSHNTDARLNQTSSAGGEEGWQTVQHNRQSSRHEEAPPPLPGPRPNDVPVASTEQEDHDFALALQLQEEEDARQREEQERRRREQQLSEQLLSGQNEGRPPAIPPRRGGSRQSTSIRPPVSRPADSNPDAPPTYEQSASDQPYREGNGQSAPLQAYDALRRQEQQSAYAAQNAGSPTNATFAGPHGRRTSYGARMTRRTSQQNAMPGGFDAPGGRRPGQAATAQDAEERCTLM